MPRFSVYSVRCSLVYLVLGFLLGGLILAEKGFEFMPAVWQFLPLHIEFLLIGWTVQFALGVAFWILPRFTGGSRGNQPLAWLSLGLLNLGILLVVLGEILGRMPGLVAAGRASEAAAGLIFVGYVWGRVRAPRL